MNISGGDLLLRCIAQEKVRYIFGVVGGQWLPFIDAIYREGKNLGVEYIGTRHEQAAAHMADAYARLTGIPGVCLGTVGPGAVDLVPGTYPAYADSIPMVILTVQNQTWKIYPDHGSTQGCDQLDLFKGVVKWNALISHWKRIPELVQRAFRTAAGGQPGPVHLDIPVDVLAEMGPEDSVRIVPAERYRAVKLPVGNPELVKKAAKILVEAQYPLIHPGAGSMRSRASKELAELADYLGAPVIGSVCARDVLPNDHPLYYPAASMGALTAMGQADAVLMVGSSLCDYDFWGNHPPWGHPDKQKWIQIDIDPNMIGVNRDVDVPIIGDAKETLKAILEEVKKLTGKKPPNPALTACTQALESQREQYKQYIEEDVTPIHPLRIIKEVREYFPRNAISIVDGGNTALWYTYLNLVYEPGTFLQAADSGHLGVGLPYAIAAKLVDPKRPVYAVCGDGSFMLNIQELETAARLEVPIIIIVNDDRQWGMIKGGQKLVFGERYLGVDFIDVRYDLVAQAMGCHGERVTEPKQIRPALERAVKSGKPAVIDVVVDREANLVPPDLAMINAIWLEGVEMPKVEEEVPEKPKVKERVPEAA
ncbi:MAG: thiamine pyrophosphate-binding protein [Candidatus Jordarchaeum sp.]|uniref:thiamine pyrophosphate-binding protein n=1 Tax=Candidatus Jordarchaeum sp. TaxID=2823881 RepID=UPI004049F408